MKIVNLDQRSPDWHAWRKAGLGSSDAPVLWFGRHFRRTVIDLWREKTGRMTKQRKPTAVMQAGIDAEPALRAWYERLTGVSAPPVCAVHESIPWCKGSLDGWADPPGLVVEYKRVNADDHLSAVNGEVPEKYRPQLDHLLLLSGAQLCHYVSECNVDGLFTGASRRVVVSWPRDEERVETLRELGDLFWEAHVLADREPIDWLAHLS